jgi:leader peptidase (prepilin peptidase)/N-methyltransferase
LGGAALGAVVGSFLATAALRLPEGRTLLGSSTCDGCGAPVPAWRLVPMLSFLLQRGRAACCGAPIDPVHPAMEVAAALIGAGALTLSPDLDGLLGAVLGWGLLLLAVLDLRHFWLPDRVTLPLLGLGVAAGPAPLAERLLAAAIAGGGLLAIHLLYRAVRQRDGLGLGDVKLAAALGAWLSPVLLPPLLLLAAVLGLAMALPSALDRRRAAGPVPFGACLAAAGWLLWAMGAGG